MSLLGSGFDERYSLMSTFLRIKKHAVIEVTEDKCEADSPVSRKEMFSQRDVRKNGGCCASQTLLRQGLERLEMPWTIVDLSQPFLYKMNIYIFACPPHYMVRWGIAYRVGTPYVL